MTSLREELESPRTGGTQCLTCTFIDKQPTEAAAEWHEVLADASLMTSNLYRLARRRGFPGGQSAFATHRRDHELDPE